MKSILLCAVATALFVAGPARGFDPWVDPAHYELQFEVELEKLPEGPWRLWVPLPNFSYDQHEIDLAIESPVAHQVTWDDRGNRMVYLEGTGPVAGRLTGRFEAIREASAGLPSKEIVRESPDAPERHLEADRLIPLGGVIADLGEKVTEDAETPDAKVRAMYDYVVKNMKYAKKGKGWGKGDAVWACASKYGNCTDFHSVLLGMARSQGIPARFVMGFPIPPGAEEGEIPGYHCWAQIHLPERGWIPMDASEASKSGLHDEYFGRIPADRIAFNIGRDLVLAPRQAGEPLNYFIYPYLEADGAPAEAPPWKLRYKRIPLQTSDAGARPTPSPTSRTGSQG